MAAITATATAQLAGGPFVILRNASAQATTGQTDYVAVPSWARYCYIWLNVSAVAGTTPLTDFKLSSVNPVTMDDGDNLDYAGWNGITQIAGTTAADIQVQVGPGITGIADDDTGPFYSVNGVLPPILGFVITLDRTTADETYTYSLAYKFTGK